MLSQGPPQVSHIAAIRVHSSRAEQLRRIAEARGLTIAGAIESFIRAEIKAGTIPRDLPGFEAVPARDAERGPVVTMILEGRALPAFNVKSASAIADYIEHLITTRGRKAGAGFVLKQDGSTLVIARKGTAIVMRVVDADGTRGELSTLTFGLASDFCSQIHGATHAAAVLAA